MKTPIGKNTMYRRNTLRLSQDHIAFLIPSLLLWIMLGVLVASYSQIDLHLLIAGYRTEFLDAFMPYYTEVGGFLPWLVIVGLLFYRFREAMFVMATQILASLVVQPLKHTIDADRPRRVFEQLQLLLPKVEGVQLHSAHSFPSGHTAAAFAWFFSLALLVKRPCLKFLFFVLALLAAYSRVYLSQHFTEDVFAGSIIGVLVSFIYYMYQQRYKVPWLEKSLVSVIKK
jgi:membrane-associated phospholipid phosphatase